MPAPDFETNKRMPAPVLKTNKPRACAGEPSYRAVRVAMGAQRVKKNLAPLPESHTCAFKIINVSNSVLTARIAIAYAIALSYRQTIQPIRNPPSGG